MLSHKVDVPGPVLGRDPLRFDSCKRPPSVSDHSVFASWVVAYRRFELEYFKEYYSTFQQLELSVYENWAFLR